MKVILQGRERERDRERERTSKSMRLLGQPWKPFACNDSKPPTKEEDFQHGADVPEKKGKKIWNMIWSPQGFHTDCLVHAACPRRPMQACCCLAPFSTSVSQKLCQLSGNSQTRPARLFTCAMPLEHTQELKTSSPPLMHQCSQGKGLYHPLSWTSIQKVI